MEITKVNINLKEYSDLLTLFYSIETLIDYKNKDYKYAFENRLIDIEKQVKQIKNTKY